MWFCTQNVICNPRCREKKEDRNIKVALPAYVPFGNMLYYPGFIKRLLHRSPLHFTWNIAVTLHCNIPLVSNVVRFLQVVAFEMVNSTDQGMSVPFRKVNPSCNKKCILLVSLAV